MFDSLIPILEVVAPFMVATRLLFLFAVGVISISAVMLLAHYSVRCAGFVFSWQPKGYVGAPRHALFSDAIDSPRSATDQGQDSSPIDVFSIIQSDRSSAKSEEESQEHHGSVHRVGALTGVVRDGVPQRDVKIVVTPTELFSEISDPSGPCAASGIDYFEIRDSRGKSNDLLTLTFVLTDHQRMRFYATRSRFDVVILLDQIVANIGYRRREFPESPSA